MGDNKNHKGDDNRTSQYKQFSNVNIFLQKINNVKVSIYIAVIETEVTGTQLAGGRGGLPCPKSKCPNFAPIFRFQNINNTGPA